MGLRDDIKADAVSIFANTDEFAEEITYFFRAGGSRTFNAVIDRDPPTVYGPGGQVVLPEFTLEFPVSDTDGVEPADIDTGGDYVELLSEFGAGSVAQHTVLVIMRQDLGMVQIACK